MASLPEDAERGQHDQAASSEAGTTGPSNTPQVSVQDFLLLAGRDLDAVVEALDERRRLNTERISQYLNAGDKAEEVLQLQAEYDRLQVRSETIGYFLLLRGQGQDVPGILAEAHFDDLENPAPEQEMAEVSARDSESVGTMPDPQWNAIALNIQRRMEACGQDAALSGPQALQETPGPLTRQLVRHQGPPPKFVLFSSVPNSDPADVEWQLEEAT